VAAPEEVGQFAVGDLFRVEFDLDRLGMIPQSVIGGVLFRPPRVSDTGPRDAFDAPEPGIRSPESAEGEGGGLRAGGRLGYLKKCHSQKKPRDTGASDDSVPVFHG